MLFSHKLPVTVLNVQLVVQYDPSQRSGDSRFQFQRWGFSASSDASYKPANSSAATASFLPPLMVSCHSSAAPGCSLSRCVAHSNWRSRLDHRSEEHTSELQALMRISYAVFCMKKNNSTLKIQDTSNIYKSTTVS